MANKIYFDNACTSFPKASGVGEAVKAYIEYGAYNINRGDYQAAYDAAEMVMDTREQLKNLVNAEKSKNIIFTPGVTFSINYFLKGFLRPGAHVVISSMEHNSVMRPLTELLRIGVEFSVAQADTCGLIDPERFEALIKPSTRAIVVTHASNVCGTILPIEELGDICRRHGIVLAVDTAQTLGSVDVDMKKQGISFLAFAGHKGLLGPQGIGGFACTEELAGEIRPVISGGTGSMSDNEGIPPYLPDRFEAGTMNLPGIAGLNASLKYINSNGVAYIRSREQFLTSYFIEKLRLIDGIRLLGLPEKDERRTAVVSVDFLTLENDKAAYRLDNEGMIMTRVGLHCAPRAHMTLGTFPKGTVRFSFSHFNTEAEIDNCIQFIKSSIYR